MTRASELLSIVLLMAGCASAPPGPPMTVEQKINEAVQASALAGHDYMQTYVDLYTMACTNGTVTDKAKCDQVAALRAERAKQNMTVTLKPGV